MMHSLEKFMDTNAVVLIISFNTLIVLIFDDIRLAFLPKNGDYYVDGIIFFCFLTFMLEFILSCLAKKTYPLSFFFWMDCISLISMFSDIYSMVEIVLGNSELNLPIHTTHFTHVAHAGRASKVGARAGRLIKLLKIIRIMRVAKFYRMT
jgi:hypothetical protein